MVNWRSDIPHQIGGLTKYREHKYSQNYEDGMLKEILEKQNINNGFFVDIGSWDGVYLSNTLVLMENGWTGICIEGDPKKSQESIKNLSNYNVKCINSFITCENDNTNVNYHLRENNVKDDFELFTIDIDSIDWWVWKDLKYNPKIVLVEYNSNHKNSCTMKYQPGYKHINNIRYYGASAPAFLQLGIFKGYDLVGMNHVNMFFVRKDINKCPILNLNSFPYYKLWGNPAPPDLQMQSLKNIDLVTL